MRLISDNIFYTVKRKLQGDTAWPPPKGHGIRTIQPNGIQQLGFSLSTQDGGIFAGGELVDEVMEVKVKKEFWVGKYKIDGEALMAEVSHMPQTRSYPLPYHFQICGDEEEIKQAPLRHELRQATAAANKKGCKGVGK